MKWQDLLPAGLKAHPGKALILLSSAARDGVLASGPRIQISYVGANYIPGGSEARVVVQTDGGTVDTGWKFRYAPDTRIARAVKRAIDNQEGWVPLLGLLLDDERCGPHVRAVIAGTVIPSSPCPTCPHQMGIIGLTENPSYCPNCGGAGRVCREEETS
jgi:hypothetical protein